MIRNSVVILFFGVCFLGAHVDAQASTVPPPVNPTALTNAQSAPSQAGATGNVDSAIEMLYAQIPSIVTACSQIQTQVEQGLGYVPNTSSPIPLIIQYIELQDIQASCGMITQTKQLTDPLQAALGQNQNPAQMAQNPQGGGQTPQAPPS